MAKRAKETFHTVAVSGFKQTFVKDAVVPAAAAKKIDASLLYDDGAKAIKSSDDSEAE